MKIRGMSYQKGIFFIGERFVACAYEKDGEILQWIKPLKVSTVLIMMRAVFFSMPFSFQLFSYIFFGLIFVPKFFPIEWNGFPYYFLLYYLFGTHFMFPSELRKYHGAEHKVFSDRGMKKVSRLFFIKKANITNRFCSTNVVVIYFTAVISLALLLFIFLPFSDAFMWASYSALLVIPIVNSLMNYGKRNIVRKFILTISYWLQEKWTTSEPERKHLLTAIYGYANLAEHEFPEHFEQPKMIVKKETKKMAIVDVTVIPVGTKSTQLSEYVASIHKVLENYEDQIKYQLTPMSTIIEGELSILFEVIQAIHEVPFQKGVERVVTNIRIDDRRDKEVHMEDKVKSVQEKLTQE